MIEELAILLVNSLEATIETAAIPGLTHAEQQAAAIQAGIIGSILIPSLFQTVENQQAALLGHPVSNVEITQQQAGIILGTVLSLTLGAAAVICFPYWIPVVATVAGEELAVGLVADIATVINGNFFRQTLGGVVGDLLGPRLVDEAVAVGHLIGQSLPKFMNDAIHNLYLAIVDPVVIDLTGSGLNLTSLSESTTYFNSNGGQFANRTSWIASGTGLLGTYDASGQFQLLHSNGDLADLDSNRDGAIESSDASWANLVVWQDTNNDGVVDPSELTSLSALGIDHLTLSTSNAVSTVSDVNIVQAATAHFTNGQTSLVASASFSVSTTDTRYVGPAPTQAIPDGLPNLTGYGDLPDLQTSMGLDSTLLGHITDLDATSTGYDAALTTMLFEWAGVENVDSRNNPVFDGQKLAFIQAYLGNNSTFGQLNGSQLPFFAGQADLLQSTWDGLFSAIKARMLVQSASTIYNNVFFVDEGGNLILPYTSLPDAVAQIAASFEASGQNDVAHWFNALTIINASASDLMSLGALDTTALYSQLVTDVPDFFSPSVLSAASSGTLSFVSGSSINGVFAGTATSDLFAVQQANALLSGFGGSDEFVIAAGLGTTEVNVADDSSGANNVLYLSASRSTDVRVSGDAAGDIVLTLDSAGDTVKLDHMLSPPSDSLQDTEGHDYTVLSASTAWGVQRVIFSDGTSMTSAQLIAAEMQGGGDVYGTAGADTFDGHGTDRMEQGNGGGDTFTFKAGYGALEISETVRIPAEINLLTLGAGIASSNIGLSSDAAGDLILTDGTTGDRITLDGQLASISEGVQRINFADGTSWSAAEIDAMADLGSATNTALNGSIAHTTFDPAGFARSIQTSGGNSTILFNSGYGRVEVLERDPVAGDDNVLRIGPGIVPSDVVISGDPAGDVILTIGTNGDVVQLDDMMLGGSNGVQTVRFDDGTAWGAQQIVVQISPTSTDGFFSDISYSKGAGAVVQSSVGISEVQFGALISASDVLVQTNSTGDLVLKLRDSAADSLTLVGNFYLDAYGATKSHVGLLGFDDGSTLDLNTALSFTWAAKAGDATLKGSSLGPNTFILASGGQTITAGSGINDFLLGRGDGHALVNLNGGTGRIVLAPNVAASDVVLQADAAGNLTVKLLDTGDSITLAGDLTHGPNGAESEIKMLVEGDGTSITLGVDDLGRGTPMTYTWIGTGAPLTGSIYGANDFTVGPNGVNIQAGTGAGGGSNYNTFRFDEGDGAATIVMGTGVGQLVLGSDIAASSVVFTSDAAGDLTVSIRGDATDSITFKGDLLSGAWGTQSAVSQIVYGDGTSTLLGYTYFNTGAPIPFTQIGTASVTNLVGSSFGANIFDLGAGGDTITAGNGTAAGANRNGFLFDKGDGHAVVTMTGATGYLQLGADIRPADVTYQADAAGDLTVSFAGDAADSITFLADLTAQPWGTDSLIDTVDYGDGTSAALGQPWFYQGSPISFTWNGGATAIVLTGSALGSNTYIFGAGGDTVDAASGGYDPSKINTYEFGRGDGHATVNVGSFFGTLQLGSGIAASDVFYQADDAGDLTVSFKGDTADSITFVGDLSAQPWGTYSLVNSLKLADGSSQVLGQPWFYQGQPFTFTYQAGPVAPVLSGTAWGSFTFIFSADGDQVIAPGGNYNPAAMETYVYGKGDGHATVTSGSDVGTLSLGAGISTSDVQLGVNASNDLTVTFKGDTTDSITFLNDISAQWYGTNSTLAHMKFADGSVQDIGMTWINTGAGITFTEGGSATNTVLTGSGYGANDFVLAPGGDTATGGNGSLGGSNANTYEFGAGDGAATVNPNGGTSVVKFTGFSEADLMISTNANGDFIAAGRGTADSITVTGALAINPDLQVEFADGTTWSKAQLSGLASAGTAGNDALVGTAGNDILDGRGGADTVAGNGGNDTYLFSPLYVGSLTTDNTSPANAGPMGQLDLGRGMDQTDTWFARSGDDLTVQALGTANVIDIQNWFAGNPTAQLAAIQGGDGAKIDTGIGSLVSARASYAAANPSFAVGSASAMPVDPTLQTAIGAAWHQAA